MDDWRSRIGVEPGERTGRPVIRGMRIAVEDVLSMMAAGMTTADILRDFSELEQGDIQACLAYATDLVSQHARSNAGEDRSSALDAEHGSDRTKIVTLRDAAASLDSLADEAHETLSPVRIRREGKPDAILMSERDFGGWQETVRQLSNPGNARDLLDSIKQSRPGVAVDFDRLTEAVERGDPIDPDDFITANVPDAAE